MRGANQEQDYIFSYHSPADRVPSDHPLRMIKEMANRALKELSADFSRMYSAIGRSSIPPEKLIRALLLQVLYSIRSERLLMEELDYNLLFRWFVGLSMEDEVWDHSTFSKNRDRLLDADIVAKFFVQIREQARAQGLLSDEHFTVDGTLIEAWASQKSFQPKEGGPSGPTSGGDGRNEDVDYPRTEEEQRNARLYDGPRCAAVEEESRRRSAAELYGPCAHGEPQRVGGGPPSEHQQRHRRAGGRGGDGQRDPGQLTGSPLAWIRATTEHLV